MKFTTDVSDLKDQFLRCREKGHNWNHVTDHILSSAKKVPTLVQREWACPTCGTGMHETIEIPSFNVRSRKYLYSDGYLVKQPTGERLYVQDVRREAFIRAGLIKRNGSHG